MTETDTTTSWVQTSSPGFEGQEIEITPYMHWWLSRQTVEHSGLQTRACRCSGSAPIKEVVPLPDFAWNPKDVLPEIPDDLTQKTTAPPKDAVITGIIDEGIALGHARFRTGPEMGSRVLSAWQQGGRFGGPAGNEPQELPFGHELFQADINALFAAHSTGTWLDEGAFNRAAGLTEMRYPLGSNALEREVAHGSHVLDLAAGFAPDAGDVDLARRPIIAVSLPRRETIGMAGTFLQFFVIEAMHRIVAMADALWAQHYPDDEGGGFPVVINLSFGQHAGPKNGTGQIEQAFKALAKTRGAQNPLRLVMPVGNSNMSRGTAISPLEIGEKITFPLRVLPEDQSSNFVELWIALDGEIAQTQHPLLLHIISPSGDRLGPFQGQAGHHIDIGGAMRLYAERVTRADTEDASVTGQTLYRYVLCAGATLDYTSAHATCEAGTWLIEAEWDNGWSDTPQVLPVLFGTVQVDQAAQPGSLRNKRAYFDHPAYRRHDAAGRAIDSYAYPLSGSASDDLEPEAETGPVQRKGSHNAIASADEVIIVAGHRRVDGKPASYSATWFAPERTPYGSAETLTASFPTELAPAHFGLRAAGPRTAATVLLRGTSFAVGLATRHLVDELLAWRDADSPAGGADGSKRSLQAQAANHEATDLFEGPASAQKMGSGRLPAAEIRTVPRLTWGQ